MRVEVDAIPAAGTRDLTFGNARQSVVSPELDLITGRPLPSSDDEPVRQAVEARLLSLGYSPTDIGVDVTRTLGPEHEGLRVVADLLVKMERRPALLLRCARGSLITREKEAMACARIISSPVVPLAVVANADDAELLDAVTGQVLALGLAGIPSPEQLGRMLAERPLHWATPIQITQAARIYATFSAFHCEAYCR